ncbi:MAG: ABC transporter ATP-binding protein/permease [candidate division Zixibacteria bacterium]|nr:ABC transporter ATP-binding protein/permease [candidate division Zixibacteria bacterium]MBU1471648.1 ABC transporter ATP-binding protein/permease [candidate division Zixibacteria bacterium]MBU2626294.1 ABC transporter ATP-binding protein/permease [candidate division Zixibacteria bacterium]
MLDKIKWFWRYYKEYGYVLAVLILLTPVQTALHVLIPRLIEFTVDYVKTGDVPSNRVAVMLSEFGATIGLSTVAIYAISLVLVGLCANSLYAFVQSHRAWMNLKLEWLFRQKAFDGITLRGPDFFNKFRTGDLVTRMTDDVAEKLSWFACSGIFRLYEAVMIVIFTIVMMASIDPMLALWSITPLPFLIVIFFKSSSLLDKRFDHLQTRISRFNDVMEACFSGIRVVKAYVKEKAQRTKFDNAVEDRRDAEIAAIKSHTVIESLYMYIWQFAILIVLVAGGYMVINSGLSLGKLMAFIYYIVYLVFPMFDIGQFLVKSRQSAVSIDRLMELENVPPMVTDVGLESGNGDIKGRLSFENVILSFPGSERNVIDDISLDIEPSETIALVGKVGSGKSWFVNMIPRLVDPTSGKVRLDGHDLRTIKLKGLRESIGYVPQEPVLFSDTVKNNIVLGRKGISDEVIDWAVDVSQLKQEIETFPDRIDTNVGTRGMTLSGGQKQRLALARALVSKPRILILDDCTSALDSATETSLWEKLHDVMPDMTAIVITHRPDTLERADRIYVFDEGKVAETGTHDELMDRGERYARMYKRYRLEEEVACG